MNVGKKRPQSHIVGTLGVDILKSYFPDEWVVREYTPDYGIDLGVELFHSYKDGYVTTGEHIFFQVKGSASLNRSKIKVHQRGNVEKGYTKNREEYSEIEVIKFVIDTDLLVTVEKMGSAIPVILAVVDIITHECVFVCLNDYIEKVLIPEDGDYAAKQTKTIYIPQENTFSATSAIRIIEWYAKRPKLFALFNKINYQARDLEYIDIQRREKVIQHFLEIIMRSDAWSAQNYFGPMLAVRPQIDYYLENGITLEAEQVIQHRMEAGKDVESEIWESPHYPDPVSFREAQRISGVFRLWGSLTLMGDMFEDVTKEAYLPTALGVAIS